MSSAYLARVDASAGWTSLAVSHVTVYTFHIAAAQTLASRFSSPARLAAGFLGVESVLVSLTASVCKFLTGTCRLVVVPTREGRSARTRGLRQVATSRPPTTM